MLVSVLAVSVLKEKVSGWHWVFVVGGLLGAMVIIRPGGHVGLGWAAVLGLVGSVVGAFYYLRLIKTMWFEPSDAKTDAPAVEVKAIAYGAALFSCPIVLIALIWLDPLARIAAKAFGHA